MERGPLALFGAILAVGLGPAMWLGAQFGESTVTPQRPPAVTVQQNEIIPPGNSGGDGGAGAGDTPTGPAQIIATDPQTNAAPSKEKSKVAPAASPSASASPSTSESADPSTGDPAGSESPAPDDSETTTDPDDSGTPPTESTTEPADDPTKGTSEAPADPDVPTTDVSTEDAVDASYSAA